jgi:transposase-like protein
MLNIDRFCIFAAKSISMDCPKCRSGHHVKDGIVRGKQRHKCKDCHFHYTVERKSDVKTPEIRRLALELYLEGLGFRSIVRILKISYGTVYVWVKDWESNVFFPRRETPIEIVELEKMLAHIQSKNAIHPNYGLILIDLKDNISFLSVK